MAGSWSAIITYPQIPNGTANSSAWNVPERFNSMTVITPILTSATWKLQMLSPVDQSTWVDLWTTSTNAATPAIAFQLSGFSGAAAAAQVFPYNMVGGGQLRMVTSGNEGALRQLAIIFDRA